MSSQLLTAGFALLAVGNLKGTHGCYETNDVPAVAELIRSWRQTHSKQVPKRTPLLLTGPSSGGFFATQAARYWREVRALSIQVSVPSVDDVRSPLPSGAAAFPPLQVVLLTKDTGKAKEAEALKHALPTAEVLTYGPVPVHASFFSDALPGFSRDLSSAVRDQLVKAGHLDGRSMVASHPSRGSWRNPVRTALEGKRSGLPQGSLQLAMDSVFASLDRAYAYHASTCEAADRTIAFFRANLPK